MVGKPEKKVELVHIKAVPGPLPKECFPSSESEFGVFVVTCISLPIYGYVAQTLC